MTLNRASGETFDGMQTALRPAGISDTEINQGYRDLIELLGRLDSRTEMLIGNSIWGP